MNISSFTNNCPLGYWQNRYNANQSEKFSIAGMVKKDENSPAAQSNYTVQAKLRKLSQADDQEKVNEAIKSYTVMQKTLMQRIKAEESKIESYNELDGKINYYSDLLRQCGSGDRVYADDLKYDLAGSNKSIIARSDIERYLEKAEASFDNLVNWEPLNDTMKLGNSLHARNFASSAAIFSEATGITSDWLDISDDISLFSHHEGITKENFIETAEKKIESLKERSNGLSELMREYKKMQDGSDEPFDEIKAMEKYLAEITEMTRQNFLLVGELNDANTARSILDTMA